MRTPWPKYVALFILIPLLLFGLLFVLLDANKLKPLFVQQVSTALGKPVAVSTVRVMWWPLGLEVQNLTVDQSLLKAERVRVSAGLLGLLRGNLDIQSLEVDKPVLEAIEESDGAWNLTQLGGKSGGGSEISLALLRLNDARVGVTRRGQPRVEYQDLDLEIRGYRTGQPFTLTAGLLAPGGERAALQGTVRPEKTVTKLEAMALTYGALRANFQGEVAEGQIRLTVDIPATPLAEAGKLFLPPGLKATGELSGKLNVGGSLKAPVAQGKVEVKNFRAEGGGIASPVETPRLALVLSPERIQVEPVDIRSGKTQLQAYAVLSQYTTTPRLEATLLAPQAQLGELLGIARAYGAKLDPALSGQGEVRLQVRAHGLLSQPLQFAGNGGLQGVVIHAPSVKAPVEIPAAEFRFAESSAQLSNATLKIGQTTLAGEGSVTNFARPNLRFRINSPLVDLDELQSLLQPSDGKPSQATAAGNIQIGRLRMGELEMTTVNAEVDYRDSQLQLKPLTASLYGGRQTGEIRMDMRGATPLCDVNLRLDRIDSTQLIAAVTPMKGMVSGPLTAQLQLRLKPGAADQVARSLNGTIQLSLNPGRLTSFDLTEELSRIGKFIGLTPKSTGGTQVASLEGSLNIKDGLATTEDMKLRLSNMTAALKGKLHLADQTLDLRLVSVLDEKFSQQVGGNKVGGFLSAVLANPQGNLMIPARISGTFAKPQFAPDPEAMAKLKLESFQPQDPKQMKKSVESIVDIFRKKKKD